MSTRTSLDRVLTFDTESNVGWLIVAISVHVGVAALMTRHAVAAPMEPQVTEVVDIPVPEQEKPTEREKPEPAKVADTTPSAPAAIAKPQPALGKAAPILAAKTDAPADEPTSFVSDPDGKEFGSGVVGKGGTADVGEKGGKPNVAPVAAPVVANAKAPSEITPAANLSRSPKLEGDPCRGFFPANADEDHAVVTVAVVVRADGSVASANVVKESVVGQGFGQAARSCLLSTRFTAALDSSGKMTGAAVTINVRFAR